MSELWHKAMEMNSKYPEHARVIESICVGEDDKALLLIKVKALVVDALERPTDFREKEAALKKTRVMNQLRGPLR